MQTLRQLLECGHFPTLQLNCKGGQDNIIKFKHVEPLDDLAGPDDDDDDGRV